MNNLPKKILKISDLTFILPDDFDGSLQNALMILAAYLNVKSKRGKANFKENDSLVKSIFDDGNGDYRVSMEYGILELGEDGQYTVK